MFTPTGIITPVRVNELIPRECICMLYAHRVNLFGMRAVLCLLPATCYLLPALYTTMCDFDLSFKKTRLGSARRSFDLRWQRQRILRLESLSLIWVFMAKSSSCWSWSLVCVSKKGKLIFRLISMLWWVWGALFLFLFLIFSGQKFSLLTHWCYQRHEQAFGMLVFLWTER